MAGGQRFRALNKPCVLLIVIAGIERFVFKGVASNLVIYLTDVMEMSNSAAARTVNSWCGFTSMLPLLVAPLVDSYWNRYSTILASSFLYLVGLLALTSTAVNKGNSPSSSSLFWSLYLISLGQGGYNPSLQAFGADQIDTDDELPTTKTDQKSDKKGMFFQWWYFGICSGSLLGVSIMPNIQDSVGWGLGFAMPAMAMVVSMVMFSCGSRFYSYSHDQSNDFKSLEKVVQALKCSVSKFVHHKTQEKSTVIELELEDKPLFLKEENGTESLGDQKSNNSNRLVKIAKVVVGLLPIWTTLLMFAVIFQLPVTFFIKQGMTMKRNIGDSYKIPPATLQSAITISIILLMPFYDTIFIPFTRFILRNEKGITTMQRIAIGMFLSVVAMIFAATLEMKRLETATESESATLSIFWLLPQYILLGISDIFTVVGMQEFFYSAVPNGMRTMGIALYTSVFGVGSFLSALMVYLVEYFTSSAGGKGNWFSDDMREARLDKYYWLLAGTSAVSLVVFVVLCRFQETRSVDVEQS